MIVYVHIHVQIVIHTMRISYMYVRTTHTVGRHALDNTAHLQLLLRLNISQRAYVGT